MPRTSIVPILCLATLLGLVPKVQAERIRQLTYSYRPSQIAPTITDKTFVICPCDPPPALVFQFKSPNLALKMPEPMNPLALAAIKDSGIREEAIPMVQSAKQDEDPILAFKQVVYFNWDSDDLSSSDLDRLMAWVPRLEKMRMEVIGHADPTGGSSDYNTQLSLQRAKHVAAVLRQGGIRLVEVKGVGDCCPISSSGKLNRRVEITAHALGDENE